MARPPALLALVITVFALYLPTRMQAFTHVVVDGGSIRMLTAGRGEAAVVFESGLGLPLESWGRVQPHVSRFARTVSYDRFGVGLSAPASSRRDGRRTAAELRQALRAAHIEPPYILVGASLGGPYVRIFAGLYAADVAGLVLVDPTTDLERTDDANAMAPVPELQALRETLQQAQTSRLPDGLPVFLIDAISPREVPFTTEAIRALRIRNRQDIEADSREYARWLETIPNGHLVVTHDSGHNVAQEQPELVVAVIRRAVDETMR